MTLGKNIGAAVLEAADRYRGRIAFSGPDGDLDYESFASLMAMLALLLRQHGVTRGDCVAVAVDEPREAIAAIAACSLLGAAWAPEYGLTSRSIADHVTHTLIAPGPRKSDRVIAGKAIIFDLHPVSAIDAMAVLNAEKPDGFSDGSNMSRLGASSGTTGEKKAIYVSVEDEWARITWVSAATPRNQRFTSMCLFRSDSGVGANTRIRTLLSGGVNIERAGPLVLARKEISQTVGSPEQYTKLFASMHNAGVERQLPLALVGGARPGEVFMNAMRKHFERITVFYGSTELGSVAEYTIAADESYDGRLEPINNLADVQIVDDEHRPVSDGTVGQVRIRGKHGMPHYIDDDIANSKSFRNGWFFPGDLGRIDGLGFLHIEGRSNDTANLGGVKMDMLRYDDFIQNFSGIEDGYCFVKADEFGVDRLFFILRFAEGSDIGKTVINLLQNMQSESWFNAGPTAIYASREVPRTETGKAIRQKASDLCAELSPILEKSGIA